MSIEGQCHLKFTIYCPGFVCFVLSCAKISGERLQDIGPLVFFVVAKTVFSLDAAYNQFYFGCAVCSSGLNFAYCAITYVASDK